MAQHDTERNAAADGFAATRWSLVAAAAEAELPLTELCLHYWYPVYAYARRHGHDPQTAQRITCAFLQELVGQRLASLRDDPPRRFREWLQREMVRFLARWGTGDDAFVASGLVPPQPVERLECRYRAEGLPAGSADRSFSRSFALEVLGRGVNRLRQEAHEAGRERMFSLLAPFLSIEPGPGQYEAWSSELSMRPLALVVALKRLRQRYRELVDQELAQTVSAIEGLDAERRALWTALRGDGFWAARIPAPWCWARPPMTGQLCMPTWPTLRLARRSARRRRSRRWAAIWPFCLWRHWILTSMIQCRANSATTG